MARARSSVGSIGVSDGQVVATKGWDAAVDPVVRGPDLIVQIRDLLDTGPCLNDGVRAIVAQSIRDSFATQFPAAYVDSACAGGPDPANEAAAFGVWLQPPSDSTAAHALLDRNIGRAANEKIAFYINKTLFETVAASHFPKDPSSSIHLHPPAQLEFRSPDTIVTTIDGVDEDPTPDVGFALTISEKFLSGPRDAPPWYESTPSVDPDSATTDLLAIVTAPVPILDDLTLFQAYEVDTATAPDNQGFGSALASAVMPRNLPIPGGTKVPIVYALREDHNGGVEVDGTGMYIGGFLLQAVPREPSVSLSGKSMIVLPPAGAAEATYTARTSDLRGKLTFTWVINGKPHPSEASTITLKFDLKTKALGVQSVGVTVTDEDGLVAQTTMHVDIS